MHATVESTPALEADIAAAEFDVRVHDGIVTVENPATGQHRTFRVRTARSGNLEGKRVVSLLVGPDNESDYQGFGFADEAGIRVWKDFRSQSTVPSDFQVFARMLEHPARFEAKGAVYHVSARCRKCGKTLSDPESVRDGRGPTCRGRA